MSQTIEQLLRSLSTSEKRFAKRLHVYMICKVGLAMNECGTKSSENLHKESYDNYIKMAKSVDLASESLVKMMMVDAPREQAVPNIRTYLEIVIKPNDVSRVWIKLLGFKSEFKNHWVPHYEARSGENTHEDPLDRVLKQVWAFRKNRSIKANNKKPSNKEKQKKLVSYGDAPDNLMQQEHLFPEVPAFLHVVKDHPFFHKNSAPSPAVARSANTTSSVSKALMSRAEQREQDRASKRARVSDKNQTTVKYEKFLDAQAAAAKEVAALSSRRLDMERRNADTKLDMEIIELGIKMGVDKTYLHEQFANVLKKRGVSDEASDEKKQEARDGDHPYPKTVAVDDGDTSVVDILTQEDSSEGSSNGKLSTNESGVKSSMFPTGKCCMGDDCKYPEMELRHKCPLCNEFVHTVGCSVPDKENDTFECKNCILK